jgi:hypothetical protein
MDFFAPMPELRGNEICIIVKAMYLKVRVGNASPKM